MSMIFKRYNKANGTRWYVDFTEGNEGMLNLLGYTMVKDRAGAITEPKLHGCTISMKELADALGSLPAIWIQGNTVHTFNGVEIADFVEETILEEWAKFNTKPDINVISNKNQKEATHMLTEQERTTRIQNILATLNLTTKKEIEEYTKLAEKIVDAGITYV